MNPTTEVTANNRALEDAASLYSLAEEFREASKTLLASRPTNITYRTPICYLICHATELYLKALLINKADTTSDDLKVHGHNLKKLMKATGFLWPNNKCRFPSLAAVSKHYQRKFLEYRPNIAKSYPAVESLLEEVDQMSVVVAERLRLYL
jgi:HEPN domain-containing protein